MFTRVIERALRDIMWYLPMQAGDVEATCTDILEQLQKDEGFKKSTF